MEVIQAVVDELRQRCQCDFEADLISSAGFRCFPQSPTAVTFRAVMTGSPQVAAQQLVIFLGDWTSSGAFFMIQAQPLSADRNCTITISSFGEKECHTSTFHLENGSGINVSTITGSAIGAAILCIGLAAIVVLIVIVRMKRKGTFNLQTPHLQTEP